MNELYRYFLAITTIILLFSINPIKVSATHVLGSDISWRCLGNQRYEMTLMFYRDCNGVANTSSKTLQITCTRGSGSGQVNVNWPIIGFKDITNVCSSVSKPCGTPGNASFAGNGIEEHIQRTIIDFGAGSLKNMRDNGCCRFKFVVTECCRNATITTGGASHNFSTDAEIDLCNIESSIKPSCDDSPTFTVPPVKNTCCNQPFTFNHGIREKDGDSLVFSMVPAMSNAGNSTSIPYTSPFNPTTWPMTGYCSQAVTTCNCNKNTTPSEGFCFDSSTGDFSFTPIDCSEIGVYVIKVEQWRLDSAQNQWLYIGYTKRDMQLMVISCGNNNTPELSFERDKTSCNTDSVCVKFKATDLQQPNQSKQDTITISWDSTINFSTFEQSNPFFDTISNTVYAVRQGKVCWIPESVDSRNTPYRFTLIASDDFCPFNARTTKSVSLKVNKDIKVIPTIIQNRCGYVEFKSKELDSAILYSGYEVSWKISHLNNPDSISYTINRLDSVIQFKGTGQFLVKYVFTNYPYDCPVLFTDTLTLLPNDTLSHEIKANFEIISNTSQCLINNNFIFSDSTIDATGNTKWTWSMGDGTLIDSQNFEYSYLEKGAFKIKLIAESGYGCKDSFEKTILVHENPVPIIYTEDSTQQCLNQNSFTLFDATNGSIAFRRWFFSDGAFAVIKTVKKVFADTGIHTVGLTVQNSFGCLDTSYLQIKVLKNPKSEFTLSDTSICIGEIVTLSNNSILYGDTTINNDTLSMFQWDFGDIDSSFSPNQNILYLTSGTKIIQLIATNNEGCSDTFRNNVEVYPSPNSVIGINDSTQCFTGHSFLYTDLSTISGGSTSGRTWCLGNGSSSSNSTGNISFNQPGVYTLKLISASYMGCIDSAQMLLTVLSSATSSFEVNDSVQCLSSNKFIFNNTSIAPSNTIRTWVFGDNTSDSILSPEKIFSDTGNYNVRLINNSGLGCIDTFEMTLRVNPNAIAGIILGDTMLFQGDSSFYSTINYVVSRQWTVNKGIIISGENDSIVHVKWTDSGIHTIKYVVENVYGCKDSSALTVYINDSSSLSVFALSNNRLVLYPNPVNDFLYLSSDLEISLIKVFDNKGALVIEEKNKTSLDLRNLTDGVYIISVTDTNGITYFGKIIKQSHN